jgi:hypothetical protein
MNADLARIAEFVHHMRQYTGTGAIPQRSNAEARNLIVSALNEFQECVRYLNTRRSDGAVLRLNSEADVQDAIYLMLRPWVLDLVPEDPSGKRGNRYTIRDFVSPSSKVIVEAKYVRDREHGKTISKELHDDIEMYRGHHLCDSLIAFIYDPDGNIPDVASFLSHMNVDRVYGGVPFYVHCIVKP